MKRHVPFAFLAALVLLAGLGSTGCRKRPAPDSAESTPASPRASREARSQAEAEALATLAGDTAEIRRRVDSADVEVPGTKGARVRLADGRGQGPGDPPAWNVELRKVAGVVQGARGLDVFVDLAIHRLGKQPECHLVLLHMDSIETVYTSALDLGEGSRVVAVEAEDVRGDVYDLEVAYLGRAPQGDLASDPSDARKQTVKVAHHFFAGSEAPAAASPH